MRQNIKINAHDNRIHIINLENGATPLYHVDVES